MDSVKTAEITICYECCRLLIDVLDSTSIDDGDREIAILMLKEKFEQLGIKLGVA